MSRWSALLLISAAIFCAVPTVGWAAMAQCANYPPDAIRANVEGTARVRVHIAADGSVTDVDLIQSTGNDALDKASVECVKENWHFRPAMQNGKPVPSEKAYEIRWALKPPPAPN